MGYLIPSSQLIPKFQALQSNPYACGRMLLATLQRATDGQEVFVDPTNPAVFVLESAIVMATAAMQQAETLTRKQYASMALDMSDVYRHMSDTDFIGRFSAPAKASITIIMLLDEIKQKADFVRNSQGLPDGTGIKKMTIPKHSEFYVANTTFCMQYGIDIRILPHGGVQVVYDTSEKSPFYSLESNYIEHGVSRQGTFKLLRIKIPVLQMSVSQQIAQLNSTTGFYKNYVLTDKFHYCRAYVKSPTSGKWVEIKTTHADQIYDARTPTVMLTVLEGSLDVKVPQIYFNSGLIRDSLRLDIYTTKGSLEMNLGSFGKDSFTAKWIDRDGGVDSTYIKPLLTFSGLALMSDTVVSGGSDGVTFAQLRNQVITQGLSTPTVPISENQLVSTANAAGYQIVKSIDNITNRVYLATRGLPAPLQQEVSNSTADIARTTVTSAGCTVLTLQKSFETLTQEASVSDNNTRLTIKPNTLFQQVNGILTIVPYDQTVNLLAQSVSSPSALAYVVNNARYFYTPFFYVLDTDEDTFRTRVYALDKPTVTSKSYIGENPELAIELSSSTYDVVCDIVANEYSLILKLAVGDSFKDIDLEQYAVQLSYLPPQSSTRVYFNGIIQLLSDEDNVDQYYARFTLPSKFDVNANDELVFEPSKATAALTTEFDLVYMVSEPPIDAGMTTLDEYIDPSRLPDYDETFVYRAIIHEKIAIKFGDTLSRLWTKSDTVASTRVIATYPETTYRYYETDVLLRDEVGNLVIDFDDVTNTLVEHIEHYAGDPVLTSLGEHEILHRKGDPILDADGNPTYLRAHRVVERQTDIMLIDGRYFFATDESVIAYKDEVETLIVQWIVGDIDTIAGRLFENTSLMYYPKITAGSVQVYVGNNQLLRIDADQQFDVEYYLSSEKFKSPAVRAAIGSETAKIISDGLSGRTSSVSQLVSALKASFGDDIISVKISSDVLGESTDGKTRYQAFTVKDDSIRPNVGKQLLALSNLKLTVVDSVNISFIEHQ